MARRFITSLAISALLVNLCVAQSVHVKAPPQADQKEVKQVGRVDATVRLKCPISSSPPTMYEWYKDNEKIDYTWERYKTKQDSKWLRIKRANEDDTGVYVCKAVNGFGSETVRIELIVIDPRSHPSTVNKDGSMDLAPPVFTYATRKAERKYESKVGDTFKVSCEVLGSPEPEIFWYKDGHHIGESVHFKRGMSTLEFPIMGTADSGVYTCKASNLLGSETMNFTLEVPQPKSGPTAIVTEAGPANTTVRSGETATLQCKVKSLSPPHVKWLKKLGPADVVMDDVKTLRVGNERYRILHNSHDVADGSEYLNRLILEDVQESDSGMYICFVTNSGFGALTYKSMYLRVVKNPLIVAPDGDGASGGGVGAVDDSETLPILILVICLSVVVFLLIVVIGICVVRKAAVASGGSTGSSKRSDDSMIGSAHDDAQRPFMVKNNNELKRNNKFGQPLPAAPTMSQWSHTVYPTQNDVLLYNQQQQQQKLPCSDSGFDASLCVADKESGVMTNQYEVPFSHLQSTTGGQFLRPSLLPQPPTTTASASMPPHMFRAVPAGQSSLGSCSGYSGEQQQRLLQTHYPPPAFLQQQYLTSDYDSQ